MPRVVRSSFNAAISVDFPAASIPSKVTSTRRSSRQQRPGHRGGQIVQRVAQAARLAEQVRTPQRRPGAPALSDRPGSRTARWSPGSAWRSARKDCLFATKEGPPGATVEVAMDLNGRRVRARLKIVRKGTMTRDGVEWARDRLRVRRDRRRRLGRASCASARTSTTRATRRPQELSALAGRRRRVPPAAAARAAARRRGARSRRAASPPGSDAKNPLLRMSYDGSHARRRAPPRRAQPPPRRRRDAAVRLRR